MIISQYYRCRGTNWLQFLKEKVGEDESTDRRGLTYNSWKKTVLTGYKDRRQTFYLEIL